jgi:hypothetical protein
MMPTQFLFVVSYQFSLAAGWLSKTILELSWVCSNAEPRPGIAQRHSHHTRNALCALTIGTLVWNDIVSHHTQHPSTRFYGEMTLVVLVKLSHIRQFSNIQQGIAQRYPHYTRNSLCPTTNCLQSNARSWEYTWRCSSYGDSNVK